MGRTYAGILGHVAFLTSSARGLISGGGVESTLLAAVISLVAFSALGYVVGRVAAWIVEESVRNTIEKQLSEQGVTESVALAVRAT